MKPITVELIKTAFPACNLQLVNALVPHLQEQLPHFLIDTELEVCHFLAQAGHETDSFKTLTEYASGRKYEYRADLGNTELHDGVKFKGHGIFQITGKTNHIKAAYEIWGHQWFGEERQVFYKDAILKKPLLLTEPKWAVASACFYWNRKDLSSLCVDDSQIVTIRRMNSKGVWYNYNCSPIEAITRKINGGLNGLDDRIKKYEKLKKLFF